jgi:3-isopropylmalate/(R)-2-methylmalate dehydratase small subunit
MAEADADAARACTVDLHGLVLEMGSVRVPVSMPPSARKGLLDGTWDVTGLLLDRYEDVTRVAAALPYLRNFDAT